MKLTLTSILAAVIASLGLGGSAGMSRHDQNTLADGGIGAGAMLPDDGAAGTLGGAVVGAIIGRLITSNDDRRGNDRNSENGDKNRPRRNRSSRQTNGFGYGNSYTCGDRYHSTSNEWLGS